MKKPLVNKLQGALKALQMGSSPTSTIWNDGCTVILELKKNKLCIREIKLQDGCTDTEKLKKLKKDVQTILSCM